MKGLSVNGWKIGLQVAIAVAQTVIIMFMAGIDARLDRIEARFDADLEAHSEVLEKHDSRLDTLDKFAARGDRWTASQDAASRVQLLEEIREVWIAIGEVKTEIASHHGNS